MGSDNVIMKASVLRTCDRLGGSRLSRSLTGRAIRILGYHGFASDTAASFQPMLFMRPETFRARMERLLESSYRVISLPEALERLKRDDIEPGLVVLTIDDGWHGIHQYALPILQSLRLPATVYVATYHVDHQIPVVNVTLRYLLREARVVTLKLRTLGPGLDGDHPLLDLPSRERLAGELARRIDDQFSPEGRLAVLKHIADVAAADIDAILQNRSFHFMNRGQLADLAAAGIELQLHTHRHRFPPESREACQEEIGLNRTHLAGLGSSELIHFCYPSGEYQAHQKAWLADLGVASATTTRHGLCYPDTDRFALPRFLDSEAYRPEIFDAALSGMLALAREPVETLRRAVR